jgi:hypothetical protein
MQALRDQLREQQRAAGVRVIKLPHALGFLDPDLPSVKGGRGASSRHAGWTLAHDAGVKS